MRLVLVLAILGAFVAAVYRAPVPASQVGAIEHAATVPPAGAGAG